MDWVTHAFIRAGLIAAVLTGLGLAVFILMCVFAILKGAAKGLPEETNVVKPKRDLIHLAKERAARQKCTSVP